MTKKEKKDEAASDIELLMMIELIQLVEGKTQKEQIRLMSLAGVGPSRISELLGTTANTVNVALSSLRKSNRLKILTQKELNGKPTEE